MEYYPNCFDIYVESIMQPCFCYNGFAWVEACVVEWMGAVFFRAYNFFRFGAPETLLYGKLHFGRCR